MNDIRNRYEQKEILDFIINSHGKDIWVQVSGVKETRLGEKIYLWCGLIPIAEIDKCLSDAGWEQHVGTNAPGFIDYGDGRKVYERFGWRSCETFLVHRRDFHGILPDYTEISEEFRFLNNLYFDKEENVYLSIKENGDTEEVARVVDRNVFILLRYLVRYATAKQMAIALYFESTIYIEGTFEKLGIAPISEDIKGENYCANLHGNKADLFCDKEQIFSRLIGKKIIRPLNLGKCGYWPFKEEKKFEEFIIGINKDGSSQYSSSDPNRLSNYFEANRGNPHYLTLVSFKKEVLQKYYAHPELYEVADGYIQCGALWSFKIDNNHKDYVFAYLGDLGRDLPHNEQLYWKSYNISITGKISQTSWKRDFLAEFSDPEISDLTFKMNYERFVSDFTKQNEWDLFLPLCEEDKHNFSSLRLPLMETQKEFDEQISNLAKILIDSLNEKEISSRLLEKPKDNEKGISKLEKLLHELEVVGYEKHVKFLRNLQELRSSGSAHIKGKKYKKVFSQLGFDGKKFTDIFDEMLDKANECILFLEKQFKPDITASCEHNK